MPKGSRVIFVLWRTVQVQKAVQLFKIMIVS